MTQPSQAAGLPDRMTELWLRSALDQMPNDGMLALACRRGKVWHMPIKDEPLTGAALARWCHDNPNLAASTIEGLRIDADKIVAEFESIFGKITATERRWLTRRIAGQEA